MDVEPAELTLTIINIEDEVCIKPPESFDSLLDAAQERFQTFQMAFSYVNENSQLTRIIGEEDYQKCIYFANLNKMNNLQIYLEGSEKPGRRRTSSFKKAQKMAVKKNIASYELKDSTGCNNDDYENNGDIRNLKYSSEIFGQEKHSYNRTDHNRIFYIKEKKDMIRQEQQEKENEKKQKKQKELKEQEEDMDFGKRKSKKKKRESDD